jgi:quercetin dioxygenase-like cupin family protein
MKKTLRPLLFFLAGATLPSLALVAQQQEVVSRRVPQFDNPQVRVWKTIIAPNQPLSMHRHENGRVIVALKGGTLQIVPENGEKKPVVWETGNAYWLDADPPGELHGDLNEGPGMMEVMVIELQR